MAVYLGTVALETNRWAPGRIPTFRVSDYLRRCTEDGFDGLELWENHFLLAQEVERQLLCHSGQIAIFNTYASFEAGLTDSLRASAAAINRIAPQAIKFNLGSRREVDRQVDVLLAFADLLRPGVRLLCECHSGTCMDTPEEAAAVFDRLDERFGAIIHLKQTREFHKVRFDAYGSRICHLHMANWCGSECEPMNASPELADTFRYLRELGFSVTYTLEFTKGFRLKLPALYENAVADLRWLKKQALCGKG